MSVSTTQSPTFSPRTTSIVFTELRPSSTGVSAALEPDVSGHANVYLGGTAMGYSRAEIDERVDEILETAGLTEFADMPLRTYSSGMKARLNFVIATDRTPEILLIDESLGVGDEEFRAQSEERIQQMLDASGTVFVVSHKSEAIRSMCTRVLWLHRGRLIADGDPDEILDDYKRLMKLRRQERRASHPHDPGESPPHAHPLPSPTHRGTPWRTPPRRVPPANGWPAPPWPARPSPKPRPAPRSSRTPATTPTSPTARSSSPRSSARQGRSRGVPSR